MNTPDGEMERLRRERDALVQFFQDAWERASAGIGMDGGDIQKLGLDLGLLAEVQVTESCIEGGCNCSDCDNIPGTCYRPTVAREEVSR